MNYAAKIKPEKLARKTKNRKQITCLLSKSKRLHLSDHVSIVEVIRDIWDFYRSMSE